MTHSSFVSERHPRSPRATSVATLLVVTVVAFGCRTWAPSNISEILRNGDRADGREVVVRGSLVEGSETDLGNGTSSFEIQDGTGRIYVVTSQAPPTSPCDLIEIHGRVHSTFATMTNNSHPGRVYGKWWTGLAIDEITRRSAGLTPVAQLFGCNGGGQSPIPGLKRTPDD